MALLLGIETSCDETAAAVVADGCRVLSNCIATQFDIHQKYGGVVPELAARAHIETLDALIVEAMRQADTTFDDLDAIAVTYGPGLIGALLVGVMAAKAIAWARSLPLVAVNHLHAHATSAAIDWPSAGGSTPNAADLSPWPAVALVVSGGHTSLYHVVDHLELHRLGATVDDAAGEAFDKVASMLNLGFPGGPVVDQRARRGNPAAVRFPRTKLGVDSLDFSFSGLKTAVLYHVHGPGRTSGGLPRLSERDIDDICASFSAAVADVLVERTIAAARRTGVRTIAVGGGVAANSMLRERLTAACKAEALQLALTPMRYCTDNAAMIAALGAHLFEAGRLADLSLTASASG